MHKETRMKGIQDLTLQLRLWTFKFLKVVVIFLHFSKHNIKKKKRKHYKYEIYFKLNEYFILNEYYKYFFKNLSYLIPFIH